MLVRPEIIKLLNKTGKPYRTYLNSRKIGNTIIFRGTKTTEVIKGGAQVAQNQVKTETAIAATSTTTTPGVSANPLAESRKSMARAGKTFSDRQNRDYARERREEMLNRYGFGGYTPKRNICTRPDYESFVEASGKKVVKIDEPGSKIHEKFALFDLSTQMQNLFTKCKQFFDSKTNSWIVTNPVAGSPISDSCQQNKKSGIPLQNSLPLTTKAKYKDLTNEEITNLDLEALIQAEGSIEVYEKDPEIEGKKLKGEMKTMGKAQLSRADRVAVMDEPVRQAQNRVRAKIEPKKN